jgi:type II secretory pathway component GspD/PulD (secretin)
MKTNNYACFLIAGFIVLLNPFNVGCTQEKQTIQELTPEKISLDLKNVEIVELLRVISLKTGKTIVPSKEVAGRITIYLSNVSFNDVLDIILLTQGLALNKKDNIYYVMSEVEYRKMFGQDYVDQRKVQTVKLTYAKPSLVFNALSQLKSDVGKIVVDETSGTLILIDTPEKLELFNKTIKELDRPLSTAIYDLNYAKAADARAHLNDAITQGTGEVIIDERSGKAIITDLPLKMKKLGMLVRELDEASRQVYVEADIIELTLDDQFQRGIDWERVFAEAVKDGLAFAGYFPVTLTNFQTISVGTAASTNYHAILNFLNTYGKTNIISQPRIAVVNNEEANIMVGVRDAYITQTQSQATSTTVTSESVEFIDVGVKLKIVPRIGADGFITMKLKPEVSSVKDTITTKLGSRVPIVQTSQSETVVKVKDGTMIMIAGMVQTEESDTITGWPLLSKIPLWNVLFGSRTKEKKKSEVIIFLTPHLMGGDTSLSSQEITKILPTEYLPESLQDKVARDENMDKALMIPPEAAVVTESLVKPDSSVKDYSSAKDYYKQGLRDKANFNNKEAIRNFIKVIELDNKYVAAYNTLGIVYEQEGQPKKAEEVYLKAISINPRYAPTYYNLALLNEDKQDFVKALAYWRKRVLYGNPDDLWTKQALKRIKELEK